jgi:hypothetical protein
MTTTWLEMATNDRDLLFAEFGEWALYTAIGTGIPNQIRVVADYDVQSIPGIFDSSRTGPQIEIDVKAEDVGTPVSGDLIAIGRDTYTVDDTVPGANDRLVKRIAVR